jgi:hypothetical protein
VKNGVAYVPFLPVKHILVVDIYSNLLQLTENDHLVNWIILIIISLDYTYDIAINFQEYNVYNQLINKHTWVWLGWGGVGVFWCIVLHFGFSIFVFIDFYFIFACFSIYMCVVGVFLYGFCFNICLFAYFCCCFISFLFHFLYLFIVYVMWLYFIIFSLKVYVALKWDYHILFVY